MIEQAEEESEQGLHEKKGFDFFQSNPCLVVILLDLCRGALAAFV